MGGVKVSLFTPFSIFLNTKNDVTINYLDKIFTKNMLNIVIFYNTFK